MNRTYPDLATYLSYYGDTTVGMVENIDLTGNRPPLLLNDIFYEPNAMGTSYIFNVNVSSQSASQFSVQMSAMDIIASVPLKIELGNELYATDNSFTFPAVADYVTKAAAFSAAAKAVNPAAKVAVLAVGADLQDRVLVDGVTDDPANMEATTAERINAWNTTIQADPSYYDALTIHISAPIQHLNDMDEHDVMDYLAAFNHSTSLKLADQASLFPGKEIWITEWGFLPTVMFEQTGTARDQLQFMKTPGMALGRVDRLLEMLKGGVVDAAAYHDLKGSNGFGVVQFARDGNGDLDLNAPMVKMPTFHVFQAVAALANSYTTVYDLKAVAQTNRTMPVTYTRDVVSAPEVVSVGFGNGAGPQEVIFINRSMYDQTVQLAGKQLARTWQYGGTDDPLPYFKANPTAYTEPPLVNPDPILMTESATDVVNVPPYSMTICTVY